MNYSTLVSAVRRGRIMVAAAALVACAGDSMECPPLPCPMSDALTISVISSVTRAALTNATVTVTSPASTGVSCSGGLCLVDGPIGTYQFRVSAAGFADVSLSVDVTGTVPSGCGCTTLNRQSLTIALTPTA